MMQYMLRYIQYIRRYVRHGYCLIQRARGKRYFPLLVLLSFIGIPALLCMAGLLIYIILPFPHTDIVVLGIDSREGDGWVARADSVMLVGIDPTRLRVTMMSVPRDLSIDVPGYGLQRINTVNMLGEIEEAGRGPALVKAGIVQSFGIETERYVRLDFKGFIQLIDAVGGVTVDVARPLVDYNYPDGDHDVMTIRFEPGAQYMNGERALIYARTRYADDDYRRAERQQQVVGALMSKLINPIHWPAVIGALQQSIDTDLNLWDMLTLAPPVLMNGGSGERLVIDRDYITATAKGVSIPDYEEIAPWLESYFD